MYITEAWLQAKKRGLGTKISSKIADITLEYFGTELAHFFKQDIYFDSRVCADDWEVVKEPKRLNLIWGDGSNQYDNNVVYNKTDHLRQIHNIPPEAKVIIEWEG